MYLVNELLSTINQKDRSNHEDTYMIKNDLFHFQSNLPPVSGMLTNCRVMNVVKQHKFQWFVLNKTWITSTTLHCAGSKDILSLYVPATFRHALKTDYVISPETKIMHQNKSRTASFFPFN